MEVNKLFLKGILKKEVDVTDEIYQKDFEDLTYKVNWDILGAKGYQIYEQNKYTYKIGELIEDADITLTFLTMDFIKQLIGSEKIQIEFGRSEGDIHLCRKDIFISTRSKTKNVNAQMLIAKIPIFKSVVPNFGASRLSKPLKVVDLEEIQSSETVEKEEIASLMKKMLSESVDLKDETYKIDFKGRVLKVNWEIGEIKAYQIFEETSYNYEYGKLHDDADLTLVLDNLNYARRFLRGEPANFAGGLDSDDNFLIYIKIPKVIIRFKDPNTHAVALSKIPAFRTMNIRRSQEEEEEKKDVRENWGGYIPVNIPLGEFENVVVPYKVFESFINKASNIILRTCPCRERGECQDHAIELGCIFMGDDTFNMAVTEDQGYVATKEQALEHTRKAIENGLIPLIGRNVAEAEGSGVKDTGHFLSCCFCCTCCCVGAKAVEYGTSAALGKGMAKTIEGIEFILDPAKCDGCGTCVEVCAAKGREIVEGKSSLNLNHCIGCGRCVDLCPNGAISIEIKDSKYIDEFISKIESLVDVEKQDSKIGT